MEISTIVIALASSVTAFVAFRALRKANKTLSTARKFQVLDYVSEKFDREEIKRARSFIWKHTEGGEELPEPIEDEDKDDLRQFLRVLDRVSNGLHAGALDKKLFFSIWQHDWVKDQGVLFAWLKPDGVKEKDFMADYQGFSSLLKEAAGLEDKPSPGKEMYAGCLMVAVAILMGSFAFGAMVFSGCHPWR